MGDRPHVRPKRADIEVVDVDNRAAEIRTLLHYYLARLEAGEPYTGMMIVAEKPRGAFVARETKMTGTDNVAERLGRLALLHDDILDAAREDEERIHDHGVVRRKRA